MKSTNIKDNKKANKPKVSPLYLLKKIKELQEIEAASFNAKK